MRRKLLADVFWVKPGNVKYPVLSIVDAATKYQTAAVIHAEKGDDYIAAIERCWVRHFGLPQIFATDEGRGWLGAEFNSWTSTHGILHEVAPGEAHQKLALVERRHQILRKAIEVYMQDMSLMGTNGIRQALCYVLPQINATPSVGGFSPSQWLLGKQIRLPGDLALDRMTPAQLDGHEDFEMLLKRRTAAKQALLHAETDNKLRRAMLRKYQGTNLPLEVGQLCFFWRDAKAADLVKIRWHGPARVVAREDKDGNPDVYWIAWKTQLLRCSPHHVRSDYTSANTQVADAKLAIKDVQSLKSRGVTRYLDLDKANRQNLLDIEDEDVGMHSDPEILEPPLQRRRLGPVDEPVLPPLPDVMPEDVSPVPTSPASNMVPEDIEPLEIDDESNDFLPVPAAVPPQAELPQPAEHHQQAVLPQPAELPLQLWDFLGARDCISS